MSAFQRSALRAVSISRDIGLECEGMGYNCVGGVTSTLRAEIITTVPFNDICRDEFLNLLVVSSRLMVYPPSQSRLV
jgi:hypothetical protein